MSSDLPERKLRHLDVCLTYPVEFQSVSTGLERIRWPYRALPEVNLDDVDLSTTFLGKRLSAPLLIGAMTGGAERAAQINRTLALAAQQTGIGLMLGSQRVMLERPDAVPSFQVREVAPDILLIGNLGIGQFMPSPNKPSPNNSPHGPGQEAGYGAGYGAAEVNRAAQLVGADALAIHLNPLQEAMQAGGDTTYRGAVARLAEVLPGCQVPVLVKEVGHGISGEVAHRLARLPLAALDVAGAGGTSWARVEAFVHDGLVRFPDLCELGVPTAQALSECGAAAPHLPLIASGGIRTGLDIARALSLGASVAALARPFLPLALQGVEAVVAHIEALKWELRVALFVAGYASAASLASTSTVQP